MIYQYISVPFFDMYDIMFDDKNGLKNLGDIIWSYIPEHVRLIHRGTEKQIVEYLKRVVRYKSNSVKKRMNNRLLAYNHASIYKLEALKALMSGLCHECGRYKMYQKDVLKDTSHMFCKRCFYNFYGPFINLNFFVKQTGINPRQKYNDPKPPRYWFRLRGHWYCRDIDVEKVVKHHKIKMKKRKTE